MMLKQSLNKLIILGAILLASCDIIPPDQARVIRPVAPIDTSGNDTNKANTPVQRVFLEDFTGHRCGNCPSAAREVQRLEDIYGDKLVAMAIHCSDLFAAPFPPIAGKFTYDFRTPVGNNLDQRFGASNAGLPKGLVNRRRFNNAFILNFSAWGGNVEQILNEAPKAGVYLRGNFNASTRALSITIDAEFVDAQTFNHEIVAYLVEDSIVNWQKDYSRPAGQQDVADYVHRHVLRDQLFVTDAVIRAPIAAGTTVRRNASINIGNHINESNASVIVILANTSTEEVLQVAEYKLKRIL
jgi:hypothetical protein